MKFRFSLLGGLVAGLLVASWGYTEPFNLDNGQRPSGWQAVGGNDLSWRFINGALNSGNGDLENYDNPSYFYQAEPGDTGRRDYIVEATAKGFQENGTFTLLARVQDHKNYYGLEYRDRSRMGRVRLVKVKDEEIQYEKTVGHGFGYDNVTIPDMKVKPVQFRLEVRGNRIRALIDDAFEMVMEDDEFAQGGAGFANFFYHFEVQDFEVTDIPRELEGFSPIEAAIGPRPAFIEFREYASEEEALQLKAYLESQRFSHVEATQEGDQWVVRTGYYRSVPQTQVVLDLLHRSGIRGGEVVEAGQTTLFPASVGIGEGAALALVVAEYPDQQDADLHRKRLEEAGYENATLIRDDATGTFKVVVGEFTSERDAGEFARKLNKDGFATIGTMVVARRVSPSPAAVPDVNELTELLVRRVLEELGTGLPDREDISEALSKYSDLLASITEREQIIRELEVRITEMTRNQERRAEERLQEEQQEIERLLTEVEAHMSAGELEDARIKSNRILGMDPNNVEARLHLDNIRLRELERTHAAGRIQREEEIHASLGAGKTLVAQGSFDNARIHLNRILAIAIRQEELSQQTRQEIDEARQLLATVDERLRQKELDSLNRLAVEAEEKGHLDRQLDYLNQMLRMAPDDEGILARVVAVQEALNKRAQSSDRHQKKVVFILYGLVIFVVLFALFYVLSWLLYRKKEEEAAQQALEIPQLTYEPAEDNFQEEEPMFLEDSVAVNFGKVISPEAEKSAIAEGQAEDFAPAGADVAIAEPPSAPHEPVPAEEPSAPEAEPSPPASEKEEPSVFPPSAEETPSRTESLEELFSEEEEKTDMAPAFGDLDLLGPVETEQEAEAEEPTAELEKQSLDSEPVEQKKAEEEEKALTEPEPVDAPLSAEPTEPTVSKEGFLPEPVEGNLLFKQGFDDLEPGSPPRNWEHSGGTLIVESGGQGGIGKCLRFQKNQGDDAYSHCRFPGIQNIFRLEFDTLAEADIQGELQILVEHDEEAEGLVQLAAGSGGQELSVQGVKTESTPGQWRHIKFIINLDKQVVNGFVDGKLVAYKVSLPASPEEINSISILGDAQSSGSLLIDNIRIYRV